jgi:hypothetical protein
MRVRPFVRGYRVAFAHARRDLARVKEDLRLEHEMMAEEIAALRAEIAELRKLAGLRDPATPLQ